MTETEKQYSFFNRMFIFQKTGHKVVVAEQQPIKLTIEDEEVESKSDDDSEEKTKTQDDALRKKLVVKIHKKKSKSADSKWMKNYNDVMDDISNYGALKTNKRRNKKYKKMPRKAIDIKEKIQKLMDTVGKLSDELEDKITEMKEWHEFLN